MTAAEPPPAGGGVASTLEKDLKELERLLKADASGGGGDAAEGNAALAAGSSVKQQLREVLRKLMEAYFAPAAVHKRETRSLLGLLKVALQRHAEVFTGSSTFCARAFSRTSSRSSRAPDSGAIWTLRSGHHATVSLERKKKSPSPALPSNARRTSNVTLSDAHTPSSHEKKQNTHITARP